jgi:serine/threonine protein kinase
MDEQYSIHGTPLYIPPERVRGEPEDFRSDFYGLGATFYHLLRGIAPFRARTATEVALMHAQSPLLVFRAHAPWVSEETCRIVEKSMKKKVSERYSSHVEFISELTLAKNQIINNMPKKPRDGRSILKNFMKSFPSENEGLGFWKNTESTAIKSYRARGMD